MQLGDYLTKNGTDKVNIVAIAWTEGRYGHVSASRLRNMVRKFHPAIRVVHETEDIVKAFSPLVYVPANFFFDSKGRRIYGNGERQYLNQDHITQLVEFAEQKRDK
ncbi:MAG: hypothetical protein ACR2OW_13850 [Methyloligellaceae bacterium]